VHYSKGYLSKVELGEKRASASLARCCDAVLDADGALAALAMGPAAQVMPGVNPDEGEVWWLSMASDGTGWCGSMTRREAFALGAASMVGVGLPPGGVSEAACHESTVAAFRSLFEQVRRLGQQTSPAVVLPTAIAQTHTLRSLAAAARSPARQALLGLASRSAEFTGWMAQEAGDDRAAMWWTRTAVEMATAGGDTDLASYSLVRQALIALYRDDATRTVGLGQQAQADERAPARVRGLAALREAQGHAMAGDEYRCRHALDRAAVLLESAGADADGLVLGPTSIADLSAVINGWCLCDLGRPSLAAEILDREVARIPTATRRAHARFSTRRALAHARAGEVDLACTITHEVLDNVGLVDSATIRIDLRRLAGTLGRWHTHKAARELRTRLIPALHGPAS
jgi:hypothetical protein